MNTRCSADHRSLPPVYRRWSRHLRLAFIWPLPDSDCRAEAGKGQPQQQQQQQHMQIQASSVGYNPAGPCGPMGATVSQIGIPGGMGSAGILDPTFPAVLGSHPNLTNPGATAGGMAVPGTGSLGNQLAVTNARTRGGMLRNDSLSSDQSHAEPHTHQHRRRHSRKLGKKKKRSSTSGMTAGRVSSH